MNKGALLGLVVFFLMSCQHSETIKISGQSYFPLHVGDYHIYQVMETDIHQNTCGTGGEVVKKYQLKEWITDSVKNSSGEFNYTIHRYTRTDSTQSWTDLDTYSAFVNPSQVVVNEDDVLFVKFIFPIVNNSQWDGNLYNDLGKEIYQLDSLPHTFTITPEKFANAFTVVQSDNKDFFVYQDKRLEVYAPSIGLIYKETVQLNYFTDAACYGQQEVQDGIIYLQSLLAYGKE